MNRLSRDSTAPRRPGGRRFPSPLRRPEDAFVGFDADPALSVWREVLRRPTF